jgi:hypothetical protein
LFSSSTILSSLPPHASLLRGRGFVFDHGRFKMAKGAISPKTSDAAICYFTRF